MAEHGYSVSKDLREAEAMVKALESYVQGDALYGSVGLGGFFSMGSTPSLTLGALLMRIRRLNVLKDQLNDEQREKLTKIEHLNAEARDEWRVHYDRKLHREALSRLDAMTTFFEECHNDPKLCARVYGPEANRRTIVQEIIIAMEDLGLEHDDVKEKMRSIDSRLRRYVSPDEFFWDSQVQPAYPERPFWWLYQRPPTPEK